MNNATEALCHQDFCFIFDVICIIFKTMFHYDFLTSSISRLQVLSLINDCYKYIMDLTTNGVVITDAIKFVPTNKENLGMPTKKEDNGSKENKEPDYDEDKDQLEEKQEEETGETTNQVF
jgi:hypothetical protein